MGLILFFLAVTAMAALITYKYDKPKTTKVAIIWGLVFTCFISFFVLVSYCTSIGLHGQKAKIAQHRTALTLYTEYANVPTGAKNKLISDLTDQKYHNYQEYLDKHIFNLRRLVDSYNSVLVKKSVLKKGFFFGLLITYPKDLKPIVM